MVMHRGPLPDGSFMSYQTPQEELDELELGERVVREFEYEQDRKSWPA
jgi:hypothetical protein